jgi:exopolysaccharide production protein ExoQ
MTTKLKPYAEILLITLLLFSFTYSSLFNLLTTLEPLSAFDAGQLLRGLKLVLFLALLVLSIPLWRKMLLLAWTERWTALLLIGALLSCLWAASPLATLQHVITIGLTTFAAYYMAARFSLRQQLMILASILGAVAFLSLIAALFFPAQGIMAEPAHLGAWKGILGHKNNLGMMMLFSALVFHVLIPTVDQPRLPSLMIAAYVVSIINLLLSDSRGSMIALLVATLVGAILRLPYIQRKDFPSVLKPFLWPAALLCLIMLSAMFRPGYALQKLRLGEVADPAPQREASTLSGRTIVWSQLLEKIRVHPILGYGYNSFWLSPDTPPSGDVRFPNDDWALSAHSGYLEFVLDIGLLGLLLFLIQLGAMIVRSLRLYHTQPNALSSFPILFVAGLCTLSLVESSLMENKLSWILYVSMAVTVAMLTTNTSATSSAGGPAYDS